MFDMQGGAYDKNQTYILEKKKYVQLNMCFININNIFLFIYICLEISEVYT